ncbi:hypothetical protein CEXT_19271 [Caerostris extrusa]|uniref:Uncharacterized protein n=1 Tax=Caerostris extrusa TaxID=172846 RepID=A0AAV4XBN9_CAEEX|nr:hypothetical protein CEXT_19271 [Caerostris extrusa]
MAKTFKTIFLKIAHQITMQMEHNLFRANDTIFANEPHSVTLARASVFHRTEKKLAHHHEYLEKTVRCREKKKKRNARNNGGKAVPPVA